MSSGDGGTCKSPLLFTAPVEGARSSLSPSLWLKWDIECVCAAHWESHYNALACCWKQPWPGAVIQNVLNEGPPSLFMCPRSQSDLEGRKRRGGGEKQLSPPSYQSSQRLKNDNDRAHCWYSGLSVLCCLCHNEIHVRWLFKEENQKVWCAGAWAGNLLTTMQEEAW